MKIQQRPIPTCFEILNISIFEHCELSQQLISLVKSIWTYLIDSQLGDIARPTIIACSHFWQPDFVGEFVQIFKTISFMAFNCISLYDIFEEHLPFSKVQEW